MYLYVCLGLYPVSEKEIIIQKEIELRGDKYIVYLKEVPTQIAPGGEALKSTVRAFIKKVS